MTSTPQEPLADPSDPAEADSGVGSSHGTGAGKSALEEPGTGGTDYVDDGVLPEPDATRD